MFDIVNTYSTAFQRGVQIVRQTIPNNGHSQTLHRGISPYQRYKGLSSLLKKAGNRRDTPDTKYSIYKHHISKHYMFDMRDIRFDMFDMKVWQI